MPKKPAPKIRTKEQVDAELAKKREGESVRSIAIGIVAENVDDKFLIAHELEDSVTFEAMGADSMDKIEIVMECETAFNIEIGDEEEHETKTVGQLVALCERKAGRV